MKISQWEFGFDSSLNLSFSMNSGSLKYALIFVDPRKSRTIIHTTSHVFLYCTIEEY